MNSVHNGVVDSAGKKIDPFIFLFSITLFLSASLTFIIQPIIGKMLLPLVGGAPSGWLVTMAYFQLALLAGYALAHALARLSVFQHMMAVIAFLFAGITAFPLHLHSTIIESSSLSEVFGVFLALFLGLTIPCVALFTLSPSIQRLFDAGASVSRDPYFLFAASNIGSLGGLLAYPAVIERVSGLTVQMHVWQEAYLVLIVLCASCMLVTWHKTRSTRVVNDLAIDQPTGWIIRGRWVFLAFIPSSLMLGVTAHITTDIGSVPFLWVIPLALYLLTFILAFARNPISSLTRIDILQTISIALFVAFFVNTPVIGSASDSVMIVPLIAFFMTALFCHFTLAAERPAARKLTEFYLWVALGGALGGIFNTFVAPFIFPLPIEFLLVALLSCMIHRERSGSKDPEFKRAVLIAGFIAIGAAIICATGFFDPLMDWTYATLALVVLCASMIVVSFSPRALVGLSLVFGGLAITTHHVNMLAVHRDFFGITRIFEDQKTHPGMSVRTFYHGSTLHGQQEVAPQVDVTPHAYYEGSLGDLFNLYKPSEVGIVGMGAGTTLCYQAPGRHFTIYELDPAVPVIAAKWFDYIHVCGTPTFIIGDGRRMLAAATNARYDLLTIDAFTSDAIPMHLLTKEAFKIYFDRLKPQGILAIHISNRFYDLRQPISNIVFDMKLNALTKMYWAASKPLSMPSRWVVLARDAAELKPLRQHGWQDLPSPAGRAWTDDFSNALSALYILQPETDVTHAQTH